jgi:hypothetical protein
VAPIPRKRTREGWGNHTQMYGPPPNCKRFEVNERIVRVNVSGLLVENQASGHAMMIRTCRSF